MIDFPKIYQHSVNQGSVNANPQNELQFFVMDTRDNMHFRVPAPWEDPEHGLKYLNWKCVQYLEDAAAYQKYLDDKNNKRGNGNANNGLISGIIELLTGKRSNRLRNSQRMS